MDAREFQIKMAQARLRKAAERHSISVKLAACCKARQRKMKKNAEAKEAVKALTKQAFLPLTMLAPPVLRITGSPVDARRGPFVTPACRTSRPDRGTRTGTGTIAAGR